VHPLGGAAPAGTVTVAVFEDPPAFDAVTVYVEVVITLTFWPTAVVGVTTPGPVQA
jgi:hypothetical protein